MYHMVPFQEPRGLPRWEIERQIGLTTAIFAPVLPIDFHSQSEYLNHIADDLADSVAGLALYSASLLPDIPATTAISRLPRLSLDENSSPREILRQISLGMDLFTIPFIGFASDPGLALTFQFPPPSSSQHAGSPQAPHGEADQGTQRLHSLALDMFSSSHAKSMTPLVTECDCYTCTSHHRAYLQHLLSAKEMLGWVLLQIHNHHNMSTFFSSIRQSISAGTFEVDCRKFEAYYESDLPEGTGQKPRVRGYHYRSEGPGETKRNKPAWGALGDPNGSGDGEDGLVPDENSKELKEKGFAETASL